MNYSRRHITEEKPAKKVSLPVVFGFVMFLLLVTQIFVSNRLASLGTEINTIDKNIQKLTEENELLREQTASASSLMAIKEKAHNFGFTKRITPIYLSPDLPVAAHLR